QADIDLQNLFSKALKTDNDRQVLVSIEQRLPAFLDLEIAIIKMYTIILNLKTVDKIQ
ncbi:unnamed protein product, partial [Didymodactylos carnosus]